MHYQRHMHRTTVLPARIRYGLPASALFSVRQEPYTLRRLVKAAASSVRQPKNPKDYASMDDLRDSLHRESGYQLSLTTMLNWLGNTAFGYGGQDFFGLAQMYQKLTRLPRQPPLFCNTREHEVDAFLASLDELRVTQLMSLILCSRITVAIIARKFPPIMEMELKDVAYRMVSLKKLLPGCDVARLVELQPRAFLGRDQQQVEEQVQGASELLRQSLQGADIDRMIEEDPLLMFTDIHSGIRRLRELWDVDAQALRNSDPAELALAIRALSDSGPPKRF